jgi:hypothetical protein
MSKPIDIGSRRELFVDDLLLDHDAVPHGLAARLQLLRPERKNIALTADAPWEDDVASFHSITRDGDRIRLYYRASIQNLETEDQSQTSAIAESTDGGVTFQRPDLSRVEWDGSRRNNVVQIGGVPQMPPTFIDTKPGCPENERFKGLGSEWEKLYALGSPDGVEWHMLVDGPLDMPGQFDTINTAFWDTVAGCYRCFTRTWDRGVEPSDGEWDETLGAAPTDVRVIQTSTSDDFIHWTPPVRLRYHDGDRFMQLYTNSIQPCPGAEHIQLAFCMRYMESRKVHPDHYDTGVSDGVFMASRDGVNWTRYREAWVRPGLDQLNWTERNIIPVWGIVETSDSEWSMYVSEHYRHTPEPVLMRRLSTGPRRFVSIHSDFDVTECVTKPITFSGSELRLNFATGGHGWIRVELQDEHGKPVPGYSLDDCTPVYGDELEGVVTWGGAAGDTPQSADVSSLAGRPVRIRFELRDADVWGFQFAE